MLRKLWAAFLEFFAANPPIIVIDHTQPTEAPFVSPPPAPLYQWDSRDHIRHSVRVICDEAGMTLEQKNTLCATIAAESGFNLKAKYENKLNGQVWSTDWGLCQWNDHYHGKEISPKEAVENPEKAVRLMAKYWKMGELYRCWWVAYKNGSYRNYL